MIFKSCTFTVFAHSIIFGGAIQQFMLPGRPMLPSGTSPKLISLNSEVQLFESENTKK